MTSNRVFLTLMLLGVGLVLGAYIVTGTERDVPAGAVSWENGEGAVTVTVSWDGVAAGPVFDISLNTHSVDLDQYDLTDLAVLRTGSGTEIRPLTWDAPKGGHHRSGQLTFPETIDGMPTVSHGTPSFALIIRDIDGVAERVFDWKAENDAGSP